MRLDLNISECMRAGVRTLPQDSTVLEAASVLKEFRIGSVIVTNNKTPVGIITERDIVHKVVCQQLNVGKVKLNEVMSKPIITINSSATIQEAAIKMRTEKIRRLPVLDKDEKLIGIISEDDLIAVYPGIVDVLSESPSSDRF